MRRALLVVASLALFAVLSVELVSGALSASAVLNNDALQIAQSESPDMPKAADMFKKAFTTERKVLRQLRKNLRKQLDAEFDARAEAGESEENEEEPEESEMVLKLRSAIKASKAAMAEYLNNRAVTEMRQSYLYTAKRLLKESLELVPENEGAVDNMKDVDRLIDSGSEAKDDPDDALTEDEYEEKKEKERRARRKAKKAKKRKAKKGKKKPADEEEEEEEEEDQPKKKKKKAKKSKKSDDDDVYNKPAKRIPQRAPEPTVDSAAPRKKRPTALDRTRRPNTNPREKFPRVHVAHLDLPENAKYKNGLAPFILIGAMDNWDYESSWAPSVLGKIYPDATVDFYPHNMDQLTVRPYLTPLSKALQEQMNPTHAFPESATHPGSYIQWNVNWRDWKAMSANMGKDGAGLPAIFSQDNSWLMDLQDECFDTHELQDEFTLRTHWRMLLIGNRGAGMFNHQDVLRTASYQAQVAGSKRWHVCAPSESVHIGPTGGVDVFDPDYEKYPSFRKARCYEDVVETNEMIFYPADYWHQTENVETPTISVTATIMDRNNYDLITEELDQECKRGKYKWGFSKKLCDALQNKCFAFWKKQYGGPAGHDEL